MGGANWSKPFISFTLHPNSHLCPLTVSCIIKKEGLILILMWFLICPFIFVIIHLPQQFDSEEQQPVLNVFDSQLCSPSEENLRGRPAHKKRCINYAVDYACVSTFFFFYFPCKILTAPGKLCGGAPMTANFPGARPHGTLQDCEMDVAWQELMAITELQVAVHHLSHCKDGAWLSPQMHQWLSLMTPQRGINLNWL